MKSAIVITLILSAAPVQAEPAPRAQLAITNVTIIDVKAADSIRAIKRKQTVLVAGDRISAVGPFSRVRAPRGAKIIDGRGKYLIPGLWDMHAHLLFPGMRDQLMAPLVPNGITGVRDMGGDQLDELPQLKRDIASGKMIGPRIVAAGPLVDGPEPVYPFSLKVANAAQAREAVRTLKAKGADFIKPYSLLPRDAYFALADESKRQSIAFAGHVPHSVTAVEATDSGQKSIEHVRFHIDISVKETELRRELAEAEAKGEKDHELSYARRSLRPLETLSEEKVTALGRRFAKNGTWFVPTLTVHRGATLLRDLRSSNDPRRHYMPKQFKQFWEAQERRATDGMIARSKAYYAKDLRIVELMHRAGVQILAGSDMLNPNVYPGFSLHDELELLVKAGLTPFEALRAATWNPALFLDQRRVLGSIERGKFADLVMLDANPLVNVENTRRIDTVILNGRYFPRERLTGMLLKAKASAGSAQSGQ